MNPAVATLCVVVCLAGCARSGSLPPVSAGRAAPVGGAGVSNDPVRQELRRMHVACDGRREALIDDVDDARRRLRRVTGAAAVAWFLGEVLAGDENSQGGSDLTSARCDPAGGGGAGRSECVAQAPILAGGGSVPSPAEQERRSVELDAAAQVRAINRAADEVDMLLFASPDPAAWTETERDKWEQLHEILLQLCD